LIQLEIFGRPVPYNSTKLSRGHFYNPKQKEKDFAQWQIRGQFNQSPIAHPVEMKALYYFKIPKATSAVKRKQMLANIIKHDRYPDTDRVTNFVKDVLKGIALEDDKIVWHEDCRKLWCNSEKEEKIVIYLFQDKNII
jgi:Holliday junction resolvase RusA-like endonuclease